MPIGLFLDRDGTINEEVEFLSNPAELRLIPGSAEAIKRANELGMVVVVVSNQSGVARGFFSERDVEAVNNELIRKLAAQGARIDAIYYCPHHIDGVPPYNTDCDCRKPNTGMFRQAAGRFDIDLHRSFMVGDRLSDLQAGNKIGGRSILVLTGYGKLQQQAMEGAKNPSQTAEIAYIANDLAGAVAYIQSLLPGTGPS